MTLLEPDVTLTDYGLTGECFVLAWLVWRQGVAGGLRFWFINFFSALGLAALFGGTAHGFVADKDSTLHFIVWSATMLAIGWAALSAWGVGGRVVLRESGARWLLRLAVAVYAAYAAVVLFIEHRFVIAIVHYLPAVLFLLVSLLVAWRRGRKPALLAGAIGLLLTFLAAGLQQAGIGLHPHYFNHNALYHLLQAVALVLIYLAARALLRPTIET